MKEGKSGRTTADARKTAFQEKSMHNYRKDIPFDRKGSPREREKPFYFLSGLAFIHSGRRPEPRGSGLLNRSAQFCLKSLLLAEMNRCKRGGQL
jgi:hypothetical protein